MHGVTLTARNADLSDMRRILEDQRARGMDLVVGPQAFYAEGGRVVIDSAEAQVTDDGVSDPNGRYDLTDVAEEGFAEKLGIPRQYLRKMREGGRLDLWDTNMNGWLHGIPGAVGPYGSNLMLRFLRGDETGTGVLRAVLSDRYGRIDNLDVLVAGLTGMRDAGITGQVTQCDLSERRMYVTIEAPEVKALAPELLKGYRSPWGGGIEKVREVAAREGKAYEAGQEPILHAGVKITNSETGNGAFSIAPHLVIEICGNGLTVNTDALRAVHLGGRMDAGEIAWSHQTQRKMLELVASKAKDAVTKFLSPGYLETKIAEMTELSGTPVTSAADTIKEVAAKGGFPKDMADDILNLYIAGGQPTAGGVMQAFTAQAQRVEDADLAAELEAFGMDALAHAARIG
jgi:hypothetical protein